MNIGERPPGSRVMHMSESGVCDTFLGNKATDLDVILEIHRKLLD